MIEILLFIALMSLATTQPTLERMLAGFVFTIPSIPVEVFAGEGFNAFFFYASTEGFIPAMLLFLLNSRSLLVIRLQYLCFMHVLFQGLFYVAWECSVESIFGVNIAVFFEQTWIQLYIIAAFCLADLREDNGGGRVRNYNQSSVFFQPSLNMLGRGR